VQAGEVQAAQAATGAPPIANQDFSTQAAADSTQLTLTEMTRAKNISPLPPVPPAGFLGPLGVAVIERGGTC